MLIQENSILLGDPILAMVAKVNGNEPESRMVQHGIYQVGHFGSSGWLQNYNHYPEFASADGDHRGAYGVCDSVEQLLAHYPELEAPGREFVVTINCVKKANQEWQGGWRWHKWGTYIGTLEPQCEYLYDEPEIVQVYVYHIYESCNSTKGVSK